MRFLINELLSFYWPTAEPFYWYLATIRPIFDDYIVFHNPK